MEYGLRDIFLTDVLLFFKGVAAGFIVAVPLGPASVVCLRRTLQNGFLMGICSGVGVAAGDTFYGSLAVLGLSSVAETMVGWINKLHVYAGILLILLGACLFRMKGKPDGPAEDQTGYVRAALSTFGMTLANPFILVLFTAILTAVGAVDFDHSADAMSALISGIFCGIMAWWLMLSGALTLLHRRVPFQSLAWANKFAGGVIMAFGAAALLSHWHA